MKNGFIIDFAETKRWYKDDNLHREDGPAVEYENGDELWYLNGLRHREGGPAAIYSNGTKYWYLNGKPHREDGPAVEFSDGLEYWYLNGERIFVKSNEEFLRMLKLKALW